MAGRPKQRARRDALLERLNPGVDPELIEGHSEYAGLAPGDRLVAVTTLPIDGWGRPIPAEEFARRMSKKKRRSRRRR